MTDDLPVDPDAIVQTALQLLPVPAHGDDFWADLSARLDAERPATETPSPVPVATVFALAQAAPSQVADPGDVAAAPVVELAPDVALALVPPALRRRSNLVLSALAVAAAVLVVVAGTTLVRQRNEGDGGTTETAAGPSGSTTTVAATATSVPTLTSAGASPASDAVLAWVGALGHGDTDAAWAALGPASQAHWGSRSAFADEASALAEGFGAWSAATPDEVYVTSLTASGDGELVVVTLVGTVEQEGTRQQRADAFPVRIAQGTARLEPFAFAGELEVVVPAPVPAGGERPVVHHDDELVVVVPRGVVGPMIRLDDGETLVCGEAEGTELTELEDAPGQRCSYRPDGGIEPGHRVLTVAFTNADGTDISAESVLFEAA